MCSALAGLERLSVTALNTPPIYSAPVGITPHLSQLTRLSALCVEGDTSHARVSGSFLTGLTGLVNLKLHYVLSADNATSDIRYLAMLTRLQWLDVASVPKAWDTWWIAESSPEQQRVLVRRGDLQPLEALRMLVAWDLDEAWHWEGDKPNYMVGELRGFCGYSTGFSLSILKDPRWRRSAFHAE